MDVMSAQEIQAFLRHTRFGVLGLASGSSAYAVPLFFGFDGRAFYFHGPPGAKSDFAEATSEACLTVVDAASEDVWSSVMVFGPIERVDTADGMREAMDALLAVPYPPAIGRSASGEPARSSEGAVRWRLVPLRITGRRSARPAPKVDRSIA